MQPDSTFTLTITWTPAEEGGIRELIVFSANGVLKHQAVLLGRAEATKKKKVFVSIGYLFAFAFIIVIIIRMLLIMMFNAKSLIKM